MKHCKKWQAGLSDVTSVDIKLFFCAGFSGGEGERWICVAGSGVAD